MPPATEHGVHSLMLSFACSGLSPEARSSWNSGVLTAAFGPHHPYGRTGFPGRNRPDRWGGELFRPCSRGLLHGPQCHSERRALVLLFAFTLLNPFGPLVD